MKKVTTLIALLLAIVLCLGSPANAQASQKSDSVTGVFEKEDVSLEFAKFLQLEGFDIVVPSLDTPLVSGKTNKGFFNLEDVGYPNFELPSPYQPPCSTPVYAVVGGKPIPVEGGIGSSNTQVIWTHTPEQQQIAVDYVRQNGFTVFVPSQDGRTLKDIAYQYLVPNVTGKTEHITIEFTQVKDCLSKDFPNTIDIDPQSGQKFVYVVVAEAKGKR